MVGVDRAVSAGQAQDTVLLGQTPSPWSNRHEDQHKLLRAGAEDAGQTDFQVHHPKSNATYPEGLIGVTIQGAALINAVLDHQRQEQHAVNIAYVQLLNAHRYFLPLCCLAPAPGVQEGSHTGCNHLYRHAAIHT